MKFCIFTFAALASFLVFPIEARADCSQNACDSVQVDRLYVNASGVIYVGTSGNETGLSCTPVSNVYLTLDPGASNFSTIYSTLLTAQIAEKPVIIRTVTSSTNCRIQYVVIDRV